MSRQRLAILFATTFLAQAVGTAAHADFVINDDPIVDGSTCTGNDCVNGESFGFDTLRLKENNLRIHFQDTSSTASFPSMDWRITINDSSNGGQELFSVSDQNATMFKLRAGAPNNSLVVDPQGDLGLGTDNPVVDIHSVDGDTPTLRLEQNGSSGWNPQTWDMAGNETNFFIRDVTNGSSLPFRIRPGAPTSAMEISAAGNVGLGTASPDTKLDVVGGDGTIRLTNTDSNSADKLAHFAVPAWNSTSNPVALLSTEHLETFNILHHGGGNNAFGATNLHRFYTAPDVSSAGVERMRIQFDGKVSINRPAIDAAAIFQVGSDATNGNGAFLTPGGVWTNGSSRANKINITSLTAGDAMDAIKAMRPVTYNGKQDSAETYVGFIAEEIPDLIAMNNRKGIAAIEVAAVLTKVIQDHQQKIDQQAQIIEKLNARLDSLEAQVATSAKQ